ncbi:hypothetical protein Ct61P_14903 [Colletotrichum tofieldiae]|nr:hypothetical protein Ct61P_14903 [Colletotrichum tofieldiae]
MKAAAPGIRNDHVTATSGLGTMEATMQWNTLGDYKRPVEETRRRTNENSSRLSSTTHERCFDATALFEI